MSDFEDHSIRQRQVDIGFTAARVLMGAIRGDADCVNETLKVPPEAWPDVWGPVAGAVHAVIDAGNKPDHCTVTRAMQDAKVPRGNLLVGEIEQITGHDHSLQPDLDCAAILREYSSRDAANKIGLIAEIAAKGDLEAARHCFADLAPFEYMPSPADPLPIADVENAGEIPAPLFTWGLYPGVLNLIIGESNAGKSMLALHAAVALSEQANILKPFHPNTQGNVLVLSGEDDRRVIKRRLADICAAHSITRTGRIDFVDTVKPLIEFDAAGMAHMTPAFRHLKKMAGQYAMIIIDPLVSWALFSNENATSEMVKLAEIIKELAAESGAAVVITHHTNKAGAGNLDQSAARGSSALPSAARYVLNVARPTARMVAENGLTEEDAPRFLRCAISKNSYGETSGGATILERVTGGALQDAQVTRTRTGEIAEALAGVLADTGARLTAHEIERGKGGISRDIADRLGRIVGGTSVRDRRNAIQHGLEIGLLKTVENGKMRREVHAA